MEINKDHINEFINDMEKILDRLGDLLLEPHFSIKKINREIHSLKGTSGFAGLINMEKLAHCFESYLSSIVNGESNLNNSADQIFFKVQEYFTSNLSHWKKHSVELDSSEIVTLLDSKTSLGNSLSIEVINDFESDNNFFSDFEIILLKEAMYRGELFYRIICHIDHDEEMKYPRLFLVVNNLEKISNVVKISPSMEDITKNKSKEITLYLTTDKSKNYIYKGLSFDRIREVEFQRLEYNSYIDQNSKSFIQKNSSLYGSKIDIETSKIEEIYNYFQDLNTKLLNDNIILPSRVKDVENLLEGLKTSLTSLTTITFYKAFSFFESYINKLSKEFGKKINFEIIGGKVVLDRQIAETLKELLIQLIKNSVDHGIESEEERKINNKPAEGSIKLKVDSINGTLAITLTDDGRGIDRKEIIKQAVDGNFIDKGEELSLISLISRPGFSTSKDVNYHSGRGVGLDIVVNSIINKLDGKIKVENRPGYGLSFHLLIPPSSSIKKYTLFKYRNNTFAFSMVNIVEKISIKEEFIVLGDNSTLNFRINGETYPIFTPWGRLSSSSPTIEEKYGFILRYLGKKAFIPVDEFVLEKEYFSSSIEYLDTHTPSHKKIKVANRVENFILINPTIINT